MGGTMIATRGDAHRLLESHALSPIRFSGITSIT